MKIRISKLALEDVSQIFAYTLEEWGQRQAEQYIADIWSGIEKVAAKPERWRLRNEVHPGCRICLVGKHAILYRLRNGKVEIARVLHGAMDLKRHIPSGFFDE